MSGTGPQVGRSSRNSRDARPHSRDPVLPPGHGAPAYGTAGAAQEADVQPDPKADLEHLGPIMKKLESAGLFRSDSMDMSNDPRFFQGSILNKRMAAFSGLGVVSGLMVGFTQSSIRSMSNMDFTTLEGQLHGVGFIISCMGLFANVIATYVSVAQVYHVYRLETAGPTGFEMATSYYLNANIVAWRHLAIKCLLLSLPLFLVSTGIQIEVQLGSASSKPRLPSLMVARACGLSVMGMFIVMGGIVWYIHSIHAWIFRDRYEVAMENESPYLSRVQSMMTARRTSAQRSHLDV